MSVDLFVTGGPNRGAYVPVGVGRYTVGAQDDADIVIEGAPPTGALILDVGTDRVRVSPAASGAMARIDGRVLGRGGAVLQPGSVIEFGDSELRAFWEDGSVAGQNAGGGKRWGWGIRLLGIAIVIAGTALFLAEMWQQDLRKTARTGENASPELRSVMVETAKSKPAGARPMRAQEPLSGAMLDSVDARVKSVLRGTGLSGRLESGKLIVTGSILTAKDEKRLEVMIAEVRPYIEVDVSAVRGLGGGNPSAASSKVVAPLKIVAINIVDAGPAKSYFETEDGARYFEGAIFGEGYVVSEIRPTSVAMDKGGVKFEYPLTGVAK